MATRKPAASPVAFASIVDVVGRRCDDPVVVEFIEGVLGKKAPAPIGALGESKHVSAPKLGVELAFAHDVKSDAFAPVAVGKKFVPYVTYAWVRSPVVVELNGKSVTHDATLAALEAALGPPTSRRARFTTHDSDEVRVWTSTPKAHVRVEVTADDDDGPSITVAVVQAGGLASSTSRAAALFVAWAAERSLLATTVELPRALPPLSVLQAVAPRGFWEAHFVDGTKPETALALFRYFHRLKGPYIEHELTAALGAQYGTSWADVDAATALFDAQRARIWG
jgi:hypothetical protein